MDEPSSVERLWEEFKLKASADARERLILHYAPLVKYVAGRVSVVPAFGARHARPGPVAPARPVNSGAWMRLLVDAAEPLVRNVSVGLGRCQGNVPE